jgi:predicted Zn-dependent protease
LTLFRLLVVAVGILAGGGAMPEAVEAGQSRDQQRFLTEWYDRADFYQSRDANLGRLKITPEVELELGRVANVAVTPSTDAEAQRFLQDLTTRLMQGGPPIPYPVTVMLYESAEVNALTVPGRMFVSTGLLKFVTSEAELAAVLSHELSHLYGHHAARRVIKQARNQALVGFLGGALVGAGLSPNATVASLTAAQAGLDLFQKAFNRGEESEADRYATHVMFNAGFPPQSLASVLTRMYRMNSNLPIKLLSTHPPLDERMEDLDKYARGFPQRVAAGDSLSFLGAIKKQAPAVTTTTPTQNTTAAPPASVPAAPAPPVVPPPASSLPDAKRPDPKRPPGGPDSFQGE